MRGSLSSTRASAILCFSPPLKLVAAFADDRVRSRRAGPRRVREWRRCGRPPRARRLWHRAWRSAGSRGSRAWNRNVSWVTKPMISPSDASVTSRTSLPSISTAPSSTSYSRGSRYVVVVLPDPDGPTSATSWARLGLEIDVAQAERQALDDGRATVCIESPRRLVPWPPRQRRSVSVGAGSAPFDRLVLAVGRTRRR